MDDNLIRETEIYTVKLRVGLRKAFGLEYVEKLEKELEEFFLIEI